MNGEYAARVQGATLRYGKVLALDDFSLDVPAGSTLALIGPDGVGKSSLMALLAGARRIQSGRVEVLGGDMAASGHRAAVCPRIAYMPQGLGRNLYPTLSVRENLMFFARLFGHSTREAQRRIVALTRSTGLHPFLGRAAGKLSGGMKQKLGLCCALIHEPDFLLLDEPTTGVDPLARVQFWELIERIRAQRPGMSVVVATAYMDEAARFERLAAMDAGRLLAVGTPAEILQRTGCAALEDAFIALLPAEKTRGHEPLTIAPLPPGAGGDIAIEAQGLTQRFGDFTAVDNVSFRIRRGEIFGFLGSNGCGKSTTMKMLTGLLPATSGTAWLFGREVDAGDMQTRRRVGYMSQSFSLYGELTVLQNLVLHAQLFHVPAERRPQRVQQMLGQFGLVQVQHKLPEALPLGMRQRLSLAVAMVHAPDMLILDEPTSGVDPVARDSFWRLLVQLSRAQGVTIFITTHFMNEAERCDRISLMHAGRVLASGAPQQLVSERGAATLEDAFISYLKEAEGILPDTTSINASSPASYAGDGDIPYQETADALPQEDSVGAGLVPARAPVHTQKGRPQGKAREAGMARWPRLRRLLACAWREALELRRDGVRATLALLGSIVLVLVIGFGASLDVDNLSYAVLDRDQSQLSRNYSLNISGSRYFLEKAPLRDIDDMQQRLQRGQIMLAIEIPPGFARDVQRGQPVEIGAWVDGSMPQRAETVRGYVQGLHQHWLAQLATQTGQGNMAAAASVQTRFRYNPDVKSLPAMLPAVIPMVLLMIPTMLTALAVVREKEMGSILNLYTTPLSRAEFMLGKQLPYVALAFFNFLCLVALSTILGVPIKGSFATLSLAMLLFAIIATGIGLLVSAATKSQIAAIFLAMIGTMLPTVQLAGLINPTSSLEGGARIVSSIYPATHMFIISRGIFNKALGFADLHTPLLALALAAPILTGAAVLLLKKQEK